MRANELNNYLKDHTGTTISALDGALRDVWELVGEIYPDFQIIRVNLGKGLPVVFCAVVVDGEAREGVFGAYEDHLDDRWPIGACRRVQWRDSRLEAIQEAVDVLNTGIHLSGRPNQIRTCVEIARNLLRSTATPKKEMGYDHKN